MPSPSQSGSLSEAPSSIAAQSGAARRTLLVVDDEEGPRNSVRAVFKNEYHVLMASNGPEAIELVRKNRIDAAVLDIRMSGMSGIELLQSLKELDPTIEVIMLTAYETMETTRRALRLGASDYLDKPFDVPTIRAAVANAIARRTLSEEIQLNNQRLRELQVEINNQKMREEIAQAKGDIYASIIHDLNGPLTIICGLVEVINHKIPSTDAQESKNITQIRDHLAHITRQIHKSIDISRRYLSFTRRQPAEQSHVGVNLVLSELGELLKTHPEVKNNQVLICPLPEDVEVSINGIDLIQILLNLSANALQCTDKPHTLEVRWRRVSHPSELLSLPDDAENRLINREGLDPSVPWVALEVSDDGPGIPAELIARMFVSAFTTKPADKGTGLGLSIVLRFIKEASGAIHVHTQLDQGTRFTIYLRIHPK